MRSIRFRFVAFIAALLIVLLLLLNTIPLISSRDAVFEEKHRSMNSRAAVIAASLSGLEQLNPAGIAEVLAFLDLSGYDRIAVTDERGQLLFDSGNAALDTADILTALTGKTVFRSAFGESAFRSSLAVPMGRQGEIQGAVYLQEQDAERAQGIWAVQRRLRGLSLAIGSAALLLSALSIFLITRRLRELIGSMRTVAAGDYHYRQRIRGQDEISQLGEEFNLLTERLERNDAERRRFVADASHELKTPLASIRLLADSVVQSEAIDTDTVREFVADIGDEAKRLQRITEKLLTLTRLDGEETPPEEAVELAPAVQDTFSLLRPLARENQVQLTLEGGEGCAILGSRDYVDHILVNLIENAVKYNRPGGSVTVRLRREAKTVRCTVEDTGIGIPEADRPHIFDRFYRVDKARSREAGGSGLGLSIVHDAVLFLGGSITVESNIPQGSRFTVLLPQAVTKETNT